MTQVLRRSDAQHKSIRCYSQSLQLLLGKWGISAGDGKNMSPNHESAWLGWLTTLSSALSRRNLPFWIEGTITGEQLRQAQLFFPLCLGAAVNSWLCCHAFHTAPVRHWSEKSHTGLDFLQHSKHMAAVWLNDC